MSAHKVAGLPVAWIAETPQQRDQRQAAMAAALQHDPDGVRAAIQANDGDALDAVTGRWPLRAAARRLRALAQ